MDDTPGLHVRQKRLPPCVGGRIAPGVGQSCDEGRPLDALRVHAPGNGVVADEPGLGLDVEQRLDLWALVANGRTGAANERHDRHEQRPGVPAAGRKAIAVEGSCHRTCSQGKPRPGSDCTDGGRVGVGKRGVKGAWNCRKGPFRAQIVLADGCTLATVPRSRTVVFEFFLSFSGAHGLVSRERVGAP